MARDYAETLRKILAKANDTGVTKEEAETFLTQAAEFAAKHGIDIAMMEQESQNNPVADRRLAFKKPFAVDKGRLWGIIARNFGCRSVILKGNVYHTYGFKSDIDLSQTMFKFLWEHGCKELGEADIPDHISARSFSTAFWAAYQVKIDDKLKKAHNIAVEETSGAELVLVKRTKDVSNKLTKDYPNLKKAANRYIRSAAGWAAGTAAGERAQVGPSIN